MAKTKQPEYLHRINVNALLKETGLNIDELAELGGYSRSDNLAKWGQLKDDGGVRPSYNTLARLLEAGASVETLFGVEYKANAKIIEKVPSEDQVMSLVRKALADLGKTP